MSESQAERVEAPGDEPGEVLKDGTLGGYLDAHERPPAFEGSDRHPYTVSVEVEKVADLRTPYAAYLVFPRWAPNAMGIVGHLETPLLGRARTRDGARELALELSLVEVNELLEQAIAEARGRKEGFAPYPPGPPGEAGRESGRGDDAGSGRRDPDPDDGPGHGSGTADPDHGQEPTC